MNIFTLITIAFQIWMLIDFFNRRPEWYWVLVILFLGPFGSLIYYLFVYQGQYSTAGSSGAFPDFFTQRRMLKELQANVHYNPTAYNYQALADIYYDMRKYNEALNNYDISLEKEPNSQEVIYKKGLCLKKMGMLNEAIAEISKVVDLDPSYSYGEAYMELAEIYMKVGDKQKALQSYEEILQRHSFIKAHYYYGSLLNEFGRRDEAKKQMQEVVISGESMPSFKLKSDRKYINLARIFLKTH